MTTDTAQNLLEESYVATSPRLLARGPLGHFNVHVLHGNEFVVYARAHEDFTPAHRLGLSSQGISEVYIPKAQEPMFKEYVADTLGGVLTDESVGISERARTLHDTSLSIVQEAFERKLPNSLALRGSFERIQEFVQQAVQFLANEQSLGAVAKLISHDYRTFSHSVHVFLYSSAILQTYGLTHGELVEAGIGAMLHDIGKSLISKDILHKRGALTLPERDEIIKHPELGTTLCAGLPPHARHRHQHPLPPRKTRRHRLPLRAGRRRSTPARKSRGHRRHLRRHDQQPPLLQSHQPLPGAAHHARRDVRRNRHPHVPTLHQNPLRLLHRLAPVSGLPPATAGVAATILPPAAKENDPLRNPPMGTRRQGGGPSLVLTLGAAFRCRAGTHLDVVAWALVRANGKRSPAFGQGKARRLGVAYP